MRVDKWLWHARFFKTRALAADLVLAGRLRLNGVHLSKPSRAVGVGDTLTFPQGKRVRVVTIAALSSRRGPASEAEKLYIDRTSPDRSAEGSGRAGPRPGKQDRRRWAQTRASTLE